MVLSCFYNKEQQYLIVTSNNTYDTHKVKDNITYFYNQEKLVALNILNIDLKLKSGIVTTNQIKEYLSDFSNYKDAFVIGQIKEIQKHPKSEKLNITSVDIKDEVLQIVCGASNVLLDAFVIVAIPGAIMPNGLVIKPSKLIDIESNGMICSLKELGLEQKEPGIHILKDQVVGTAFSQE